MSEDTGAIVVDGSMPHFGAIDPTTDELIAEMDRVSNCPNTISDERLPINNRDKWEFAKLVLNCPRCNLLSRISFEDIYSQDDVRSSTAGSYVADLRAQFFRRRIEKKIGDIAYNHTMYLLNKQWWVRMREQAALSAASKGVKLT